MYRCNLFTLVYFCLEFFAEHLLHDRLADHEKVLVQRVLETYPPLILARLELSIAKC